MTLPDAIEKNKREADSYISILSQEIEKEKKRFFLVRNSGLISEYELDIYRFKELIRASDKLGLTFSNTHYALTEINKLGRTVTNSTQKHQPALGYSVDNRFDLLYKLLEKRIQKREEFVNCISQYNDIVLSYMDYKRKEIYKHLSLVTIDITPVINEPKSIESKSYTPKLQYYGGIQLKNETREQLRYSFSYLKQNGERVFDALDEISPNGVKYFVCKRKFYDLLISTVDKSNLESEMVLTKAGFNYKIFFNSKTKKLSIMSIV